MSSEPSLPPAAGEAVRAWYRPRRRRYAWRRTHDPYAIWISEVMLQQTQAPRVEPSFERFLLLFPTIAALAEAPRTDVLRAWSGLGYNRRAVSVHEAARAVVREHGGRLPRAAAALRALPGIGPYTAGAVASIAFGERVAAIDVNVRRVVARAVFGREPSEMAGSAISAAASVLVPERSPGAWNQALMDIGREACRPAPRCERCPLAPWCRATGPGASWSALPHRAPPTRRPEAFDGSRRQVRGRIVELLREEPSVAVARLPALTGSRREQVDEVLPGLVRDGLVLVDRGRVALPP